MKLKRPHMPLSVKLQACLLLLGFTWEEVQAGGKAIQFDHNPALGLRPMRDTWDGRIISFNPPANDPRYIRPMRVAPHRKKTSGTKSTSAGSDIHSIARTRRLAKATAEHHARMRNKMLAPSPKQAKVRAWPKRKMQTRRKP